MTTPADLLATELRRDGARPLFTWYDDATGERAELSVATTANWVAKTAHLLVDEHDVQPGDVVGVLLPLHWQTAVVLLAAWSVGAVVSFDEPGTVTVAGPGHGGTGPGHGGTGPDLVTLSLAPMGADFSRLVAAQPDSFTPWQPSGADVVAAAAVDHLPAGARVLTTLPYDRAAGLDGGLIAPLAAAGSVVLVGRAAPTALPDRCRVERVTHTVGVDVAGLPRLDG